MPRITPNYVAVGFPGALTDVTVWADEEAGVDFFRGRKSEFSDTRPSEFSFVLDNATGDFTPDNAASSLPSPLSEGMVACWEFGGRLVSGRVREIKPTFPGDESAWSQVRVTCDDDLGQLARQELGVIADELLAAADPYMVWLLDDEEGSPVAVESSGNSQPQLEVPVYAGAPTASLLPIFGVSGIEGISETQARFDNPDSTGAARWMSTTSTIAAIPYAASSAGCWGFWITPIAQTFDASQYFELKVNLTNGKSMRLALGSNDGLQMNGRYTGGGTSVNTLTSMTLGQRCFFAVSTEVVGANLVTTLYQDGVSYGTFEVAHGGATSAAQLTPSLVEVDFSSAGIRTCFELSRLQHTANLPVEHLLTATTELGRLEVLQQVVSPTLDPSPDLSPSAVGMQTGEASALDLVNEIVATEQGYLYTTTTGTLTAPTQTVNIRHRERPTTPTYTFDVQDDLDGAPQFVRDLTDMLSAVTVTGPENEVLVNHTGTYTNAQLVTRVGSANSSEDILNTSTVDLTAWGEDRLNRGANVALRVAQLTIDAMTTPTDRSAELLALTPGDRIQITGLPSTQLGFEQWDGWLLGVDETHTTTEHTFTLYLSPVLPDPAFYDVDRYSGNGELTLTANINSAVTTMSVSSSSTAAALLSTTDTPYMLLIDSEQVRVTNVTSATPQVVTMVRAQNGTTAAAHTLGAAIELGSDLLVNLVPNPSAEVNATDSVTALGCAATRSTAWSTDRSASFLLTPNGLTIDSYITAGGDSGALRIGMLPGHTYTATGTIRLTGVHVGPFISRARRISAFVNNGGYVNTQSAQATNAAGVTTLTVTFEVPAAATEAFIRFYNGSQAATDLVWWDSLSVVEGAESIVFNGATATTTDFLYGWSSTTDNSASYRISRAAPDAARYAF